MESKKDIRTSVLKLRSRMSDEEWCSKSAIISDRVVKHPAFLEADTIYCYVDYKREAGTCSIIEMAWESGKKVAVPKVDGEEMQFYYIRDFSELSEGYYGIMEPYTGKIADAVKPLVIMPGAVFDKMRSRIGYGGGFYDKFLASHPSFKTLAIAFEFQVLEQIPTDSHDICPDILITEEQIYESTVTK